MAANMAVDFKEFGIAAVLHLDAADGALKNIVASTPEKLSHLTDDAETSELTGHLMWAILNHPDLSERVRR
ncbi:hypothetical protein [Mycolicibacterium tusciae]|uniref:hypothetical protein n=1 Tax=Mycolicibacterium tusciae TaxID=75922 RepID=UPI00024A32A6|nr:hypothetical protein [Mycolicibacterium tusciae]